MRIGRFRFESLSGTALRYATIAHAIVQDSTGGDAANLACPSITWSSVKSEDCSATACVIDLPHLIGPEEAQRNRNSD